jgi:hypothetical protein
MPKIAFIPADPLTASRERLDSYPSLHSLAQAWLFFASRFASTSARTTLRIMRYLWPLRLASAKPTAFDALKLDSCGIVAWANLLEVNISTIFLCHLLSALPSLTDLSNTYLLTHFSEMIPLMSTSYSCLNLDCFTAPG